MKKKNKEMFNFEHYSFHLADSTALKIEIIWQAHFDESTNQTH